jgi:hypothetical protein
MSRQGKAIKPFRKGHVSFRNPQIKCVDGALASIQASRLHYSERGPDGWLSYEVKTKPFPEWDAEYCGETCDDGETVYGYVPAIAVRAFLAAHGGIAIGALPQ